MLLLSFFLFLFLIAITKDAMAYLDPGTGGILLQLLLGGVAGILMVAKLYWKQLLRLFLRKKPEETLESPSNQ
jgi:hypothetical protein